MKPYCPIKVYRWLSKDKKILYIFDNNDEYNGKEEGIIIKETIYIDDNIEDAINKIGLYIQHYEKKLSFPIYCWNNNTPSLFNIEKIKWQGYDINPFMATDLKSKELDEPISYNFNKKKLFDIKSINIVFNNDVPIELKKNKYYFINSKIDSYKTYIQRDTLLLTLRKIEVSNKIVEESYNRVDLYYKLKSNRAYDLYELFDKLHTSKIIDLVQYVDDYSKILYKLYKYHKISKELLANWTNVSKIVKNKSINIFSIFNEGAYCKISIDDEYNMNFVYIIDVRKAIKWEEIIMHKDSIAKYLENIVKQPIHTKELSMSLSLKIEVNNTALSLFANKIGEYYDIFHVNNVEIHKNKQRINCIYKRSSNYAQNMNMSEYIKSLYTMGKTENDIIVNLQNLGISGDIKKIVADEIELLEKGAEIKEENKINIKENGTIVIIEVYGQGYDIDIINCSSKKELNFLLYWLSRIISQSITKPSLQQKQQTIQPVPLPAPPSQTTPKSSSSSSSSTKNLGKQQYNLDSSTSSSGGMIKGVKKTVKKTEKQSYFINMLHQADKDLFGENYARDKCQNAFQPIVMTKSEKEELEKNNNAHFDNVVEYGSSPNIQNYYACPRVWCPKSKISLDPNIDNPKCPLPNEEPMLMYFDNDKSKKRYVKLIKPNQQGICAPCCMKTDPDKNKKEKDKITKCKAFLKEDEKKKDDIEKEEDEDIEEKESNYIMNQNAPIPIGRYGVIPEYLHRLLLDKSINPEQCSKTLNKMYKCFVRRGIVHRTESKKQKDIVNDSLLHAVAYILNFKNKKEFVKDIINKLDAITYISLENGDICKSFMSIIPILPEENKKLIKEVKKNKSFNLKIDYNNLYSLSRTLNIYYSYKRFLEYLTSDNISDKNPEYIYSILKILYDTVLIIWESKDKMNDIFLNCPYYSTYKEINENDFNPKIGMLLKDNKYYEPIELKSRNTDGEKTIKLNEYKELKNAVEQCNNKNISDSYKKLYIYYNWINGKLLKNYESFTISTVFINNDMTINKIMTKGNILISFDNIRLSLLPIFIRDFEISYDNVKFYDDQILNKNTYNINIYNYDFDLFSAKCEEIGIKYDIGKINDKIKSTKELFSVLELKPDKILNNEIIHYDKYNEYYINNENEKQTSQKWFYMKKTVSNYLINNYDNKTLKEFRKMPKDKQVKQIQLFLDISTKSKKSNKILNIILEEIPLTSIDHIKKWIRNIIMNTKYDFFTDSIDESKSEFIFSQNVFYKDGEKVLPSIIIDYNELNPHNYNKYINKNNDSDNIQYIDLDISEKKSLTDQSTQPVQITQTQPSPESPRSLKLPSIFIGKEKLLSTKWIRNKKSKWNNMYIITVSNYNSTTIPLFIEWLSNKLKTPIKYNDIINSSRHKYYDIRNNKEAMINVLGDSSYFNEWMSKINRKFSTALVFWEDYYSKLEDSKRVEYITKILDDNKLYPNDLNMLSISEMLNISILIIHRGKYKQYTQDVGAKGELEDLVLSSTFFPSKSNINTRPLIILSKVNDKNNYIYSLILDKKHNLYMKYIDVPENVKILVEAHLK